MAKKTVDKSLYDNEKLSLFIKAEGLTTLDVARKTGYSEDTIVRYLNKVPTLSVKEPTLRLIIAMVGGKYEDFVKEPVIEETVEEVIEEKVDEPVVVNIDMSETNELLKELISTVNKLGNLEMQNMEYLKELRDLMK